jgi:hypothetical protein
VPAEAFQCPQRTFYLSVYVLSVIIVFAGLCSAVLRLLSNDTCWSANFGGCTENHGRYNPDFFLKILLFHYPELHLPPRGLHLRRGVPTFICESDNDYCHLSSWICHGYESFSFSFCMYHLTSA